MFFAANWFGSVENFAGIEEAVGVEGAGNENVHAAALGRPPFFFGPFFLLAAVNFAIFMFGLRLLGRGGITPPR